MRSNYLMIPFIFFIVSLLLLNPLRAQDKHDINPLGRSPTTGEIMDMPREDAASFKNLPEDIGRNFQYLLSRDNLEIFPYRGR